MRPTPLKPSSRKWLPASVRRLLVGAAALSASRGITMVSRLVYLVIVTRMLGPELYGLFAYARSWYLLFLPATTLGFGSLLPREVGRLGKEAARQTVATASSLLLVSALVGALTCGLLATCIEADAYVRSVMWVFSGALLCRAIYERTETLFIAHERVHLIVPIALLMRPLEPVSGLVLLWIGGGLVHLAILHFLLWGVQMLCALAIAHRHGLLPKPPALDGRAGRLFLTAVPLLLALFAQAQIVQGVILLYRWTGGAHLGQVSLLVQAALMLTFVPRAVQVSLLPAISRRALVDLSHARDIGRFLVGVSLTGGVALALAAMPLAPLVVVPIFGEAYSPAADAAWLSMIFLAFFAAALYLNQQLIAQGRYWLVFASVGVGAAVQVGVFLVLMPTEPTNAILVGGVGCVAWSLVAALNSGLAMAFLRGAAVAGAAIAVALAVPHPWLGPAAGLAVLALGSWALKVIVVPRTGT